MPSERVALALPSADNVIWKDLPLVSFTFHVPTNSLAAKLTDIMRTDAARDATTAVIDLLVFCI
jgi:hypothetical protein